MAKEFSFDVVSKVDGQEVKNAVDQARKELANRWDFKGSSSEIELDSETIKLVGDDEFKLGQLRDILESKLVKRGIDLRHVEYSKPEPGAKITLKQTAKLKQGIPQDNAKTISKSLRDSGLKVQSQIQGDQLRVSGKDKDELQKAIALIKGLDLPFAVQFENYR
ncbi:MAG: YajQ family cyclic di-GMP-binding protein [Fimbriimonadales bacterium]|nr:YajQ family cyclic di-GMP-binding protein [Fimbriimonadales bacterium]